MCMFGKRILFSPFFLFHNESSGIIIRDKPNKVHLRLHFNIIMLLSFLWLHYYFYSINSDNVFYSYFLYFLFNLIKINYSKFNLFLSISIKIPFFVAFIQMIHAVRCIIRYIVVEPILCLPFLVLETHVDRL